MLIDHMTVDMKRLLYRVFRVTEHTGIMVTEQLTTAPEEYTDALRRVHRDMKFIRGCPYPPHESTRWRVVGLKQF